MRSYVLKYKKCYVFVLTLSVTDKVMAEDSGKAGGFSLIKFDGAPIEKLIDVVSNAIGTVYKPTAMRKEADAEAYKVEAMAKAEAKKRLIEFDSSNELAERAAKRVILTETSRQINIETIADKAIKYLPESVTEKPVSKDWQSRFFDKVKDISDDDIQELWAKILAGEIEKPESSSLRLLDILSNLSKYEAATFSHFCSFASDCQSVYRLNSGNFDKYSVLFTDILEMREIGLIHNQDNLIRKIPTANTASINEIISSRTFKVPVGNTHYTFISPDEFLSVAFIDLNVIALTSVGSELCKFIHPTLNMEYHDEWINEQKQRGYKIHTGYKFL